MKILRMRKASPLAGVSSSTAPTGRVAQYLFLRGREDQDLLTLLHMSEILSSMLLRGSGCAHATWRRSSSFTTVSRSIIGGFTVFFWRRAWPCTSPANREEE